MVFFGKMSASSKTKSNECESVVTKTSKKSSKVSVPQEPAAEACAREVFQEAAHAGTEPKTGTFAEAKTEQLAPQWNNYINKSGASIGTNPQRDAKLKKGDNNIQYVTRDVHIARDQGRVNVIDMGDMKNVNMGTLAETPLFNNALKKGAVEKECIDNGFLGRELLDHGLIEKIDHECVEYEADVEVLDYESQIGDEAYEQEELLQRIKQDREVEHTYYRNHYHPHEHLKTVEHNHYVDHVKNIDHIQRIERVQKVEHKHLIEDRHLHEHVYNTQHLHNWYHRDVLKHRNLVYEEEKEIVVDLGEQVRAVEGPAKQLDGWVKEGDSHHDVGMFEIWDEQTYRVRFEDVKHLAGFKEPISSSKQNIRQYKSIVDNKPIVFGGETKYVQSSQPVTQYQAKPLAQTTKAVGVPTYAGKGGIRTEPSYLSGKKYDFRGSQSGAQAVIPARPLATGEQKADLKNYIRGNVANREFDGRHMAGEEKADFLVQRDQEGNMVLEKECEAEISADAEIPAEDAQEAEE